MNEKERKELEDLLLQRTRSLKPELESMLRVMNDHWTYEDPVYRFYHQSFKVYYVQATTERAVELLKQLLPGQPLNAVFVRIVSEGTGCKFEASHNQNWEQHTRPLLEAFFHLKFMIEMAVRYADLPEAPQPMPSGWAALLYLFNLR